VGADDSIEPRCSRGRRVGHVRRETWIDRRGLAPLLKGAEAGERANMTVTEIHFESGRKGLNSEVAAAR
jgi:hypothetical protein